MSKMYGIKIRIQRGDSVEYKFLDSVGVFTSFDAVHDDINSIIDNHKAPFVNGVEYESFVDINCHDGLWYTDRFGNRICVSFYIVELEVRS